MVTSIEATMTGRILQRVGTFVEHGFDHDGAPSLVALRGQRPPAHKAEVVAYLRAGVALSLSPGRVDDHFEPGRRAGTAGLRTDGHFAWPDYLAYYVDRHDVALPAELEAHMAAHAWSVPAGIDVRELALPRP
jgi:hypothetical protein